jgi:hypothetical protein
MTLFKTCLFVALLFLSLISLAQPANNNFASSINVTALINTCSTDALYTTVSGTGDQNAAACWNVQGGGPLRNVWFHFVAPASGQINVTVDIGGGKGTQQRSQVAIWQSNGTTLVNCNRYVNDNDDAVVGAIGLTPGSTYYISVDVQNTGYVGTFTLCLADAVDYNYYEGAIDVTSLINSCSSDALYTTIGGTSDKSPASCWNTQGSVTLMNRWFKFTAPVSGQINVTVDRGGTKGTLQRAQLALWQSNGTTQVTCNRYVNDNDDVVVGSTALTPGSTYYISVDAQNTGYSGSFTLCLSDAVDYDYYEGAINVTSLINTCSSDALYTTIGATSDKSPASCWNTQGSVTLMNRWFKFTAPASGQINVTVDRGGTKGTLQRTQLALWQSNGTTQVSCNRYVNNNDVVVVGSTTLSPGSTYYISVDAQNTGYSGSFTLCLSDAVDYDYYEGAINVTSLINTCSSDALYTTIGATSDKSPASCWNTQGSVTLMNRWFTFTAPASGQINITVDRGGTKGTLQRAELALWQSNGTTQVSCNRYVNDNDVVVLGSTTLTPGTTYYISVDAQNAGYSGSFTLCLSDAVDYDYYEGAVNVTSLINTCSSDALYTTIGATSDKSPASCWNTQGSVTLMNRWFKFTAPTSGQINITVDRGGTKGTLQRAQLALWQSDGTTQVTCNRYVNDNDDVVVGSTTLTPGTTYYISVDAQNTGYSGSFTLCLSDAVDYDYYEGAIDVTSLINTCSSDALYTTIGATSDKSPASCWNTQGSVTLMNRWFKFTAPATGQINVTVDRGGAKGTLQRTQVALWQSNGTTQVSCNRYVNDNDDVVIGSIALTPGNTYYISVDAQNTGYSGSFSLCLSDAVDYDYYAGAILIADITNYCSSDAVYTTIGATSDKTPASCWNTQGSVTLLNRWFKFVATSTGMVNVTIDRGGSKGSQQRTQVAIWQSDGATLVSCNRYVNDNDDVVVGATGLSNGNTYYISVDVQNTGYAGTFTLCVTDVVDYDFYNGAVDITDLNNWCSADAAYTTIGATSDKNVGSCWNTQGSVTISNRWFKFTAVTANATIIVDRGGSKGTQQRTQLALWQSNGTTQVACARYVADNDDVSISTSALTPGSTYYISVDVQNTGYRGTFTLCVNNIGTVFYSRQSGPWADVNTWSTAGYGGAAATSYPNGGDVANIRNHDITVGSTQQVAEINMDVVSANTSLTVNTGVSLTINGKATVSNAGNNFSCAWNQSNNSTVSIADNLTFTRSGGSQSFGATFSTGSSLTIAHDLSFLSSSGTVSSNLFTLNGTASLTVNRDLFLTSTGGQLIDLQLNASAIITVARDITFAAAAAGMERIVLNSSTTLRIGRNFVRGASPYGMLTCNNNATVEYNGSSFLQTFAPSTGTGGDSFTYQNVTINNTRVTTPQVTMGGAATINGTLTLTSGIVGTTSSNILNLASTASTTIGSSSSYVDGPMTYAVATSTANTIRNFPLGKSGTYRPAVLTVSHTNANSVAYTAEHFKTSAASLGYTLPATVDKVSGVRYWKISSSDQSNLSSARVRLYYGIGNTDGVTDPSNLTVVKNVGAGTAWVDIGGTASGAGSGNILSGTFNSFSDFTIANLNGGTNPLPIKLKSFTGEPTTHGIKLSWITASEESNEFFTLMRSHDGQEFASVAKIPGGGTTQQEKHYAWLDEYPFDGINYYKLGQTDFDGKTTTSKIIAVHSNGEYQFRMLVYPNPAHLTIPQVLVSGGKAGQQLILDIYSSQGVCMQSITFQMDPKGDAQMSLNGDLPQGLYLLRVKGRREAVRLEVF